MPTKKIIGIALTKRDADIIAWANMLTEHRESPNIWIQAILAAETLGINFDADTVYIPPKLPNKSPHKRNSILLFGDDTEQTTEENSKSFGWTVRGVNGEYTVGSILNVGASRASTKVWLEKAKQQHKILSRYIKIIVRKHIHITHE